MACNSQRALRGLATCLALAFASLRTTEGMPAVHSDQSGSTTTDAGACSFPASLENDGLTKSEPDCAAELEAAGDALDMQVSLLQRGPLLHGSAVATQVGVARIKQQNAPLVQLRSRREGLLRELGKLDCDLASNGSSPAVWSDNRVGIYVTDHSFEDYGFLPSEHSETMLGTSGDDFEFQDGEESVWLDQDRFANRSGPSISDLQTLGEKPTRMAEPNGGNDVRAFDKQGPKPGHPFYNPAGWAKAPDEQAMKFDRSGKIRHISKEDKELLLRLPAWQAFRKGTRCKSAARSVKIKVLSARSCQLKAQSAKFMFFQFSSSASEDNCELFHTCDFTSGGDSSEWDVYTDQQGYLLHAEGQVCKKKWVPNFEGAREVQQFFETEVKSIGECQAYAQRKGHHFFVVRHRRTYSCDRYYACEQTTESARGHSIYKLDKVGLKDSSDQSKVFAPFKKITVDATCKGKPHSTIYQSDAAWCWRAPIKCYWTRDRPCQVEWSYYTVSPPIEYFSCTTFSECDSMEREQEAGIHLFAKALAPWPKASGCRGLATEVEPTALETEPAQECQSKASRRGHRFYQVSSRNGGCATARECSGRKCSDCAVYETPGDPETNVTCSIEKKARAKLQDVIFGQMRMKLPTSEGTELPNRGSDRPLATALRSIFHDAQDWNRLMIKSKSSQVWKRVKVNDVGEHGGVDGCLYEPLGFGIKNKNYKVSGKYQTSDDVGSQFLNMNLQRRANNMDPLRIDRHSPHYAEEACDYLCCDEHSPLDASEKAALCGAKPCDLSQEVNYRDKCMVDVTVLGVLMIVQHVGGPKIDMMWGRRQGDCRRVFKNVRVPGDLDVRRIGLDASPFNAFGDMSVYVDDFKKLGFRPKEMVALMGAHSFGKMHKYAGALTIRNTARGFCNDPSKVSPAIVADQLKSTCVSSETRACWTGLPEGCKGTGCAELAPSGGKGWGMGGFWDTTPDKLDNEYFKMLSKEDTRQTKNCCGTYDGNCHKNGSPMQNMKGETIDGCQTDYCMRDSTSMVSTKMHIDTRRIFRLAADWALLENDEARAEVERFAKDNNAFLSAFKQAFAKVINKGYPEEGSRALKACMK